MMQAFAHLFQFRCRFVESWQNYGVADSITYVIIWDIFSTHTHTHTHTHILSFKAQLYYEHPTLPSVSAPLFGRHCARWPRECPPATRWACSSLSPSQASRGLWNTLAFLEWTLGVGPAKQQRVHIITVGFLILGVAERSMASGKM